MARKRPQPAIDDEQPLYRQVKQHVAALIGRGTLCAGDRVPSEHELVASFNISRMTANRALRELTAEGWLFRVPGLGSFVAPPKPPAIMLEIQDPAEQAEQRGARHRMEMLDAGSVTAPAPLSQLFGLPAGARLFRCLLLHWADACPLQLEERWVLPALTPEADAAGNRRVPLLVPFQEVEHQVEARMPPPAYRTTLRLAADEPCLRIRRRCWTGGQVTSLCDFWLPGSLSGCNGTGSWQA